MAKQKTVGELREILKDFSNDGMNTTLLDVAKANPTRHGKKATPSLEELDLFIALAKGEITYGQTATALRYNHASKTITRFATVIRHFCGNGTIEIVKKKN